MSKGLWHLSMEMFDTHLKRVCFTRKRDLDLNHLSDLEEEIAKLRGQPLPHLDGEAISAELDSRRHAQPARTVINTPIPPLPSRLWEQLVLAAGISRDTRWATLAYWTSIALIIPGM